MINSDLKNRIHYALILIFFLTYNISADTIHIPGDQPTIQDGLNAASFGDTVMVAPGTYFENIIWPEVDGIKLIGAGRENTIIDGNNQASVIRIDALNIIGNATLIKGFTITNGNALPPWPESQGGGIYIYDSDPILEDLTIIGNTADDFGGGLYVWLCAPIIRNTVIINNTATSRGGVDCKLGAPIFDHVTIANNTPGGLYFDTRGYPQIINSIVSSNYLYGIRIEGTSFGTTIIAIGYSDINNDIQIIGYASYDDLGGIIQENPLFVDPANNNYHLMGDSPCIDTGDPNYPPDPDGTITDMGAFYYDQSVPVELNSFTAAANSNDVTLNWQTATETNNSGFEIQKSDVRDQKSEIIDWKKIGFIKGNGTSTNENHYSYIDKNLKSGRYSYKLVQIDFDGTRTESEVINVEINYQPKEYALMQNYPNPFNPATTIEYSIAADGNVKLKIFNTLGEEVKTLVNEYKTAGSYKINFDASALPSGVYYYKIETGRFTSVKKMILLR
jgi:hypothetical protein